MTAPTTTKWAAIDFDAPQLDPATNGLYTATSWTDEAGPTRWIEAGVRIRPHNFDGESAFGIWGAPWCASFEDLTPDDVKTGTRPGQLLDPFEAMVVWAYAESDDCGPTDPTAAEVRARARHTLSLREHIAVERQFAARALADATDLGLVIAVGDAPASVATLERELGKVGVGPALVHASPFLYPYLVRDNLIDRSSGTPRTPGGHQWVFSGGYGFPDALLNTTVVATSPTYGWRNAVQVRHTLEHEVNRYLAVAEVSVVIGYEAVLCATTIG